MHNGPLRFSYRADHPLTAKFEEQTTAMIREYKGEGAYQYRITPMRRGPRCLPSGCPVARSPDTRRNDPRCACGFPPRKARQAPAHDVHEHDACLS